MAGVPGAGETRVWLQCEVSNLQHRLLDVPAVLKDLPYEHKLIEPQDRGETFLNVYRTITQDPEASGKVPTIIGAFQVAQDHSSGMN